MAALESSVVNVAVDDCPIHLVSVFNDRGEVTREVSVPAPAAGEVEVVIAGLPPSIDGDTVRVTGVGGSSVILEVSYDVRKLSRLAEQSPRARMDPELHRLRQTLAAKQSEKLVNDQSQKFVSQFVTNLTSSSSAKNVPGPTVEVVQAGIVFYQSETRALQETAQRLAREIEEMEAKIKDRQDDLRKTGQGNGPTESREVTVVVQHPEGPSATIDFSLVYMVKRAGWTPSYDIRVDSVAQTMNLTYFGLVRQNTGEDWSNCPMQLSTAVPSRGGIPGAPPKMVVRWKEDVQPRLRMSVGVDMSNALIGRQVQQQAMMAPQALHRQDSMNSMDSMSGDEAESRTSDMDEPPPQHEETRVRDTGVGNATFSIERRVNIASDDKPHKVTIATIPMTPLFTYFATPSLEEVAYLQARAVNGSAYKLLASDKVAVFFDGSFVTTTRLKDISPGEEVMTFLGADSAVRVEFKRLKRQQQATAGFMSTGRTLVSEFKTVVTNNKRVPVNVKIVGVFPRSATDSIRVDLIQPGAREIVPEKEAKENAVMRNEVTNNIVWTRKMDPGAKLELPLEYSVSYPKGKEIEIVPA